VDEQAYILIQKLIYPLTFIIILNLFKGPLSNFIERLGRASIKIDDKGISVNAEAIGKIVESSLSNISSVDENHRTQYISNTVEGIETTIEKLQSNTKGELKSKKILWVDDHPEWNLTERRAFESMGITIITSLDNQDAIKKIKRQSFDLIISDYFSDDGHKKGLDFLKQISDLNYNIPLIFYTGRVTTSLETEAKESGASGIVDAPGALSALVLKSLIHA